MERAFREVTATHGITRVGPRQRDWCSHTEMRTEKTESASRGEAAGDPPAHLLGLRQAPRPGGSVPAGAARGGLTVGARGSRHSAGRTLGSLVHNLPVPLLSHRRPPSPACQSWSWGSWLSRSPGCPGCHVAAHAADSGTPTSTLCWGSAGTPGLVLAGATGCVRKHSPQTRLCLLLSALNSEHFPQITCRTEAL